MQLLLLCFITGNCGSELRLDLQVTLSLINPKRVKLDFFVIYLTFCNLIWQKKNIEMSSITCTYFLWDLWLIGVASYLGFWMLTVVLYSAIDSAKLSFLLHADMKCRLITSWESVFLCNSKRLYAAHASNGYFHHNLIELQCYLWQRFQSYINL